MFDFSRLNLVRNSNEFFIGIRKSQFGDNFDFCLPNGFDNFPVGDFDAVRNLFFKMYRTFRKFERENLNTNRFNINKPDFQQDQDQTTLSSGGVKIQTEEGDSCILYSKIKMIERVLEAYDDLAINSIQKKVRHSEEIDYSKIDKYLDRAIYLNDDVIYVEWMDLPRSMVRYESTDLVNLYCYILDEIIEQLNSDVPDNIKVRTQDIHFLAQHFKEDYLTSNQSIFGEDTFEETISVLKEALDNIDKNTYYKDGDYWGLYEAIETFLYGELNPDQGDGEFWGVHGFSLIWEDMCNTYFFKEHRDKICYADTDIPLKGYENLEREGEEKNRVGNRKANTGNLYGNQWVYSKTSNISKNLGKVVEKLEWDELLCIEFDLNERTFVYSHPRYNQLEKRDRSSALRRFLRPDLILESNNITGDNNVDENKIKIIDYKDVPLEFYRNKKLDPKSAKKYKDDLVKQLTYEYALQQTHNISANLFFIPYYYDGRPSHLLGELEEDINIKGIKIFRANFSFIQNIYLENNL
ncbi:MULTISPECIES: LlaJI family restriction endonuclease [Nostoc]|uniref:LlaJI family restriction endonuclease n=1 Tax=Nostoc paludosum FACHB-159 TaxID=2692908 RepID=A0ABR8KD88_9NOSO|nr:MULTISPECIES: LlaJI family restriction endonuclease [Nostoc]MBD2679843.1 LlaJI family restriction endonuclease [Nostoc sp. FACHB-857]MBD2736092.1 LlaJI family restriction endonuclease [Nostoc paludosum FACHB-159]